jgi:hypothetical protein
MKLCVLFSTTGILFLSLAGSLAQPVITSQPVSQTNVVGSIVTLCVEATGTPPLFYQWRRGAGNLPGQTNACLVLTNLQTANAANYTVVVTNGEGSVTSAVALVRVIVPVAISETGQPTNFPVLSIGATVSNRVVASGTAPLSYQWRRDGTPLVGKTNAALVLTNLQLADAGEYTVVVTNLGGAVTSQGAGLSVDPTFTKITTGRIVTDGGFSYDCAWGDYDNDGFVDLFVVNDGGPGGQSNWLYRNNGNGTFTRMAASGPIVTDVATCHGCAWGDYDNDGWLDMMVSNGGGGNQFLYRNNGNGTFSKITSSRVAEAGDCHSVRWGDYDNDGWLDLFLVKHDSGGNRLFRNQGDGSFTRITAGPLATDAFASWGASWGDYNNDGYLDLLLGNDGPNNLYQNNRDGTFLRITTGPVVTEFWNTKGMAWGDYDNDGFLDLFAAHSRLFGTSDPGQNDSLYHNNGDGTFSSVTNGAVVNSGGLSLSCAWGDYDNDGFLDLFVTNWDVGGATNFLFHNNGDGTFTRVMEGSQVNDVAISNGCAWGDYDNDGFLDLFVANGNFQRNENNYLYRNSGNSNGWINLKLVGTQSNRSAIGAKVRVRATIFGRSIWQLREISGGSGFGGQNDLRASFGLGDSTNVDLVRIEWPSGTVQELRDVVVKQFLTVTEPPRLGSPRLSNSEFGFTLKGGRGFQYAIQRSTNAVDWALAGSLTVTNFNGTAEFLEPLNLNLSPLLYRAVSP